MRILQMLPKVIRPVKLLVAITLANLVHRLQVRHQLGPISHDAAEAAHIPDNAVERLGLEGKERILQRLARPRIRLDVDGVDVPLGFCRTLEPFLALCARVRLFGFVLSISFVSDNMVNRYHETVRHTLVLRFCGSAAGFSGSSYRRRQDLSRQPGLLSQ